MDELVVSSLRGWRPPSSGEYRDKNEPRIDDPFDPGIVRNIIECLEEAPIERHR
jgi:hypothetical protein